MRLNNRRFDVPALVGAALLIGVAGAAIADLPVGDHIVSQKGKRFGPKTVNLHLGERVMLVNDDDAIHYAYIETIDFTYDSVDIEPGGRAIITFPKVGDFAVLCGIHPRMNLAVHVK